MIITYHASEPDDCPETSKRFKAAQELLTKMYLDVLEYMEKDEIDGFKLSVCFIESEETEEK